SDLLATLPRIYLDLPLSAQAFSTANSIGIRLAAATIVLAIVVTIAFGTVPAIVAARRRDLKAIRLSRAGWIRIRGLSLREGLLGLQIGRAVALAVPAGLYARSVMRVADVNSGIRAPQDVLVARVSPVGLTSTQSRAFFGAVLDQVRSAPHAAAAAFGS